jgi:TP901 family phage tail tape measure protein
VALTTQFSIDAEGALAAMRNITQIFNSYNQALGQVAATTDGYNSVGEHTHKIVTQINADGIKTVTVLRDIGKGWEIVTTKVSAASAAQRKAAQELKDQADLANRLAENLNRRPSARSATPVTTGVPATNPALIGLPISAYANLTQAQLRAAAAASGLGVAATTSLLAIGPAAARAKQAYDSLSAGVESFKTKLEQAGKIAFATLIYRGISLIQQGLAQGIKTAIDYVHEIGLIQTISQDSGETFDTWNNSIRAVADELGRPVGEVAKDTYDALSNQVIKTTSDFGLLKTAITLEQNTGSAPGVGLNVLSALINGLGVSASQAESLADKLFVTIDKGRVRLEELDKVIGRTTSLQRQAGASFDETAAALALLTQSGIDSAESTTLLNNVFAEIIKPNEALSKSLLEMGFASGPAALGAIGLSGVLKELGKQAEGTKAGLATFFPDIRGLRGAGALFGQLDLLKKTIGEIQNSTGANRAAKAILDQNPAQQLIKEGERIKNFFTVDIGVSVVKGLASASQALGGFSNVLKTIVPIAALAAGAIVTIIAGVGIVQGIALVTQLATAYVTLTSGIGFAAANQAAFNLQVSAGRAGILAFGAIAVATYVAATIAANTLADAQNRASEARQKPIQVRTDTLLRQEQDTASARIQSFNQATDKMTNSYGQFIAATKRQNNEFAKDSKKAFDATAEALQNSFDIILSYARKNVSDIESAEEKSLKDIERLHEAANSVRVEADERRAARQVNQIKDTYEKQKQAVDQHNSRLEHGQQPLPPPSNAAALRAYDQIAAKAIETSRKERDAFLAKGDLKGAEDAYANIQKVFDAHQRNTEAIGGKPTVSPFQDALALEQQQKILAAGEKIKAQNAGQYAQAVQQRQVVGALADVYRKASDFGNTAFDKKGGIEDVFGGDPQKVLAEFDSIREKAKQLEAQLNTGANPIIAKRLQAAFAQSDVDFDKQRALLSSRLAAATNDTLLTKNAEQQAKFAEQSKKANEALTNVILRNNELLIRSAASIKSLATELDQVTRNAGGQTTFNLGNDPLGGIGEILKHGQVASPLGDEGTNQAQKLLADITKLSSATTKDVPAIKAKLEELTKVLQPIENNKIVDPRDITNVISISEALQRMKDALAGIKDASASSADARGQLQGLKDVIAELNLDNVRGVSEVLQSIGTSSTGISNAATASQGLADAINAEAAANFKNAQALRAVREASGATSGSGDAGGEVSGLAGGGPVGGFLSAFFSGAYARGTDVIPAMLTRDEFVVRAPMARKFFSQLVAINSNQTPIYRSEGGGTGGDVNNSSTYHIHVGNAGNGSSRDQAKTIVQAIRRAQREGTIS